MGLLSAAQQSDGTRVRIGISTAQEDLRRPPRSFEVFRQLAIGGEPVHLAVLVERIRLDSPQAADAAHSARIRWLVPHGAEDVINDENTSTRPLRMRHVGPANDADPALQARVSRAAGSASR